MQSTQRQQISNRVFRAVKSWLWSEGRVNIGSGTASDPLAAWFVRTYAVPVFSAPAQARWREARTFSGTIWDRRHLQGQALRLLRVKTICQMEVARQHSWTHKSEPGSTYGVIRKGCERMDGIGYTSIF